VLVLDEALGSDGRRSVDSAEEVDGLAVMEKLLLGPLC